MNIYIELPLPTHTTVDFDFFAKKSMPSTLVRKAEEQKAVREVSRAINAWIYAQ